MTFSDVQTEVLDRLALSSSDASTRIGREINKYYKQITTEIGLAQASARPATAQSANTTIGSQEVTFTSMEKITRVYYLSGSRKVFLDEVTFDELREENPTTADTPTRWAVKSYTNDDVVILIDKLAETQYALKADGFAIVATLSGSNTPQFPESFHDILVEAVLVDEYMRMEKFDLSEKSEQRFMKRMSDLRMWAAKSAYLDIQQGRQRVAWWPSPADN